MNAKRNHTFAIISALFAVLIAGYSLIASTMSSLASQVREATGTVVLKPATSNNPWTAQQTQDLRFKYDASDFGTVKYKSGAVVYKNAATTVTALNEPVQTENLLAPHPYFKPVVDSKGYSVDYHSININPCWSRFDTYIYYSSNRPSTITSDPANHFHIWAIPAGGITTNAYGATAVGPIQITSGSGNEYYPVESPSGKYLAFTSDINNPTTHNQDIFYIAITNLPATPYDLSKSTSVVPLTIRTDGLNEGFSTVGRPAWSPDESRIAFAAKTNSTNDPYAGHTHIYYLYLATLGFSSDGNQMGNVPGKLTNGSGSGAISEDDSDVAWSPDGRYITFSSNASGFQDTGLGIMPNPSNPSLETTPCVANGLLPNGQRAIYLITPDGTVPTSLISTSGRITTAGQNDISPAWCSNANMYSGYIAFSRKVSSSPVIYKTFYYQALNDPLNGAVTIEDNYTDGYSNLTGAQALNTSDSATTPQFSDTEPTWSGFTRYISIGYTSLRTVNYTDPVTGYPIETPNNDTASLGDAAVDYQILASELVNINPPIIWSYSSNEVIHISDITNDSNNTTPARQVAPGAKLKFIIRVSNRESGIDPNNVYIQIKDPDSKYQDSQGLEHKLFYAAGDYPFGTGAITYLNPFEGFQTSTDKNNNKIPHYNVGQIGGAKDADNFYVPVNSKSLLSIYSNNTNIFTSNDYTPSGVEYDCQYINPAYSNPYPSASDYGNPMYVAGIDDQRAFSAPSSPDTGWLKLSKMNTVDSSGGQLYTATWTTPKAPSDYYLDVIVYDKVKNWRIFDNIWGFSTDKFNGNAGILFVNDYGQGQKFPASTFGINGGPQSLRATFWGTESYMTDIDMNLVPNALDIWGPLPGSKDTTTFVHMLRRLTNIYYFGSETFAGNNGANYTLYYGSPSVFNTLGVGSYGSLFNYGSSGLDANQNPIGIPVMSSSASLRSMPDSQKYKIWRILSKGPLDNSTLNGYVPNIITQPAILDGDVHEGSANFADATKCIIWHSPYCGTGIQGAGTILDPNVQVQLSNFVKKGGRLFVNGSGIAANLSNTTNSRLNTKNNNFLKDVLNCTYAGMLKQPVLAPVAGNGHYLSYSAYFDDGYVDGASVHMNYYKYTPPTMTYTPPASTGTMILSNNWLEAADNSKHSLARTEACLNTMNIWPIPYGSNQSYWFTGNTSIPSTSATGEIDAVTPNVSNPASAFDPVSDIGFSGGTGSGLLYKYDPTYNSCVAFCSFGLEALGQEYYSVNANNTDYYLSYMERAFIMHNIVTYMRTGEFTGTIYANKLETIPVAKATVYLIPLGGTPPTMPTYTDATGKVVKRKYYSATTDAFGQYSIRGVYPGGYQVAVAANGYASTKSNTWWTIDVGNQQRVNIDMTPLPSGSIVGTVYMSDGKTKAVGATITMTDANNNVYTGTQPSSGQYSISNVPSGTYIGKATLGSLSQTLGSSVVLDTSVNSSTQADFTLPKSSGAEIDGFVYDANTNQAIPGGATVDASSATGGSAHAIVSTTDGSYKLTGLSAGTYTVTATASGYVSQSKTITVTASQLINTNTTFNLVPADPSSMNLGGKVTTTIGSLTQPVIGATINVYTAGTTTKVATTTTAVDFGAGPGLTNTVNYGVNVPDGYYDVELVLGSYTNKQLNKQVSGSWTDLPFTINSFGIIGGLAYPSPGSLLSGASITVTDATSGAIVATTTTSSTASTITVGGVDHNVNFYVNVPGGSYTYNVKLTAGTTTKTLTNLTVTGGGYKDATFLPDSVHTFAKGINFVSSPYDYSSVLTIDGIFGSNPANRSNLYSWNPSTLSYLISSDMQLGYGYWIKLAADTPLYVRGVNPATSYVNIQLRKGWNMIGLPVNGQVYVSSLKVANPGNPSSPLTFTQATTTFDLLSPRLYGYYSSGGSYTTLTSTSLMQPWYGYWIFAKRDLTIMLPTVADK